MRDDELAAWVRLHGTARNCLAFHTSPPVLRLVLPDPLDRRRR